MSAFEQEQQRLHDLLTSVETDSEIDDSERLENDHISENKHDTNSEQEDDSEITEEEIDSNMESFIWQDRTKWKKDTPAKSVRTRSQNIVTQLPGVKWQYLNLKSLMNCLSFFYDEIMDILVKSTNYYTASVKGNFKRTRDAMNTNTAELKVLFVILYYSGSSSKC